MTGVVLYHAGVSWPQAVLANWYAHSSVGLLVDGVHPSVAGRAIYVSVVVDALREQAVGGRGVGRTPHRWVAGYIYATFQP